MCFEKGRAPARPFFRFSWGNGRSDSIRRNRSPRGAFVFPQDASAVLADGFARHHLTTLVSTSPPRRKPMRIFAALLFAYTLSQFFRAFLAIVAVDLSRDLSLDSTQLGAVSASWFAAFALAQFPVGFALDRFGPRRTIGYVMIAAVLGGGPDGICHGLPSPPSSPWP